MLTTGEQVHARRSGACVSGFGVRRKRPVSQSVAGEVRSWTWVVFLTIFLAKNSIRIQQTLVSLFLLSVAYASGGKPVLRNTTTKAARLNSWLQRERRRRRGRRRRWRSRILERGCREEEEGFNEWWLLARSLARLLVRWLTLILDDSPAGWMDVRLAVKLIALLANPVKARELGLIVHAETTQSGKTSLVDALSLNLASDVGLMRRWWTRQSK